MRFLREDTRRREPGYASIDPAERVADVAVATVTRARRHGRLSVMYYASHCGRGSCGALRFFERRPGSSAFRRILGTLQVELPVVLLPTFHHGYPDIGVNTAIHDPEPTSVPAVVIFDGHRYSVTPTPMAARPAGRVLIADLPDNFTRVTW